MVEAQTKSGEQSLRGLGETDAVGDSEIGEEVGVKEREAV